MTTAGSIEGRLRELAPQVLCAVLRRYGNFADAEDAVQEALLAAAATWPSDGELIPLAEQDRTLWDRGLIAEGVALITEALPHGQLGEYQVQAAINAIHH